MDRVSRDIRFATEDALAEVFGNRWKESKLKLLSRPRFFLQYFDCGFRAVGERPDESGRIWDLVFSSSKQGRDITGLHLGASLFFCFDEAGDLQSGHFADQSALEIAVGAGQQRTHLVFHHDLEPRAPGDLCSLSSLGWPQELAFAP